MAIHLLSQISMGSDYDFGFRQLDAYDFVCTSTRRTRRPSRGPHASSCDLKFESEQSQNRSENDDVNDDGLTPHRTVYGSDSGF